MTEAYILYVYLELGSRYCVPNYQVIESDLDSAILNLQESFQKGFNRMWAKHKCDVPGCPDTLTFDGGLKPHRNICGAKMSGIRFFEKAGVYVFSGCTRQPQPDSKYCWEHKEGESPAIPADSVSQGTRQKLRGKRTDPNYAEDKFYVVESIVKIEEGDQTKTYEVKWAGFSETTIEDDDHLPKFITKYYTDYPNQLGKKFLIQK